MTCTHSGARSYSPLCSLSGPTYDCKATARCEVCLQATHNPRFDHRTVDKMGKFA